jgi:hypothetical protein
MPFTVTWFCAMFTSTLSTPTCQPLNIDQLFLASSPIQKLLIDNPSIIRDHQSPRPVQNKLKERKVRKQGK